MQGDLRAMLFCCSIRSVQKNYIDRMKFPRQKNIFLDVVITGLHFVISMIASVPAANPKTRDLATIYPKSMLNSLSLCCVSLCTSYRSYVDYHAGGPADIAEFGPSKTCLV